jgi:hypothetical protein
MNQPKSAAEIVEDWENKRTLVAMKRVIKILQDNLTESDQDRDAKVITQALADETNNIESHLEA